MHHITAAYSAAPLAAPASRVKTLHNRRSAHTTRSLRRSRRRHLLRRPQMPPSTTTEQNFRANLSQFRWARSVTDDSQQPQTSSGGGNPFSRFYNAIGGSYVPLRSNERSNEEEAYFALSRWERCVASVFSALNADCTCS